jgi:hypothetical protein
MRAQLAEEPASRCPVSRCLSATGIRFSDHPAPAEGSASLTVSPPDAIRLDPDGVVTFRTRQIRPGRAPSVPRGRWCAPARPSSPRRHPSPHNDRPLPHAGTSHRARVLMTRRQRGFTQFTRPAFPSLWPPDGTAALGPLPRASHPAVTRDARRGGDGPCALDQTLRLRHQPTSFDEHHCTRATSCRTAMLSQEPCFGVGWISRRWARANALPGSNASYREPRVWVLRLSMTSTTVWASG